MTNPYWPKQARALFGTLPTLQGSQSKLVSITDNQLRVLEHVVVAHAVEGVAVGVDVRARQVHVGLDDEGRRVARGGCRGVVGAPVAALGVDVADAGVLLSLSPLVTIKTCP